jgi:hypothetical protein
MDTYSVIPVTSAGTYRVVATAATGDRRVVAVLPTEQAAVALLKRLQTRPPGGQSERRRQPINTGPRHA